MLILFRRLVVAACLAFSAPALVTASAQSSDKASAELDKVGQWMEYIKPISNALFDVMAPIQDADGILLEYVNGTMDYEEARTGIANAKERVLLIGDDLRKQVEAIPPFPDLELVDNPRIAGSTDSLLIMIDTLEDTTISQIDVYASALEGDEDAVEMLQVLGYDQAIASIQISNQIITADIESIAQLRHPQRAVLSAARASNETVIHILRFEKGRQVGASEKAQAAVLSAARDKVREIREIVQSGKSDQEYMRGRMNTARLVSSGADRVLMGRIGAMMGEYKKAWPVELEIAGLWDGLLDYYSSIGPEEDTSIVYENTFEQVAALEDQRQALLFERVAMLKQ